MDTEDFAAVLDTVRRYVREQVVPREDEIEAADAVPQEVWAEAKRMGLFGFAIPAEYGGLGLSMAQEVRLAFELGYTTPAFRSIFGTNNGIGGQVLMMDGTEEQRRHYLPRLATGEYVTSFALTEPDAGSDPSTLTTRARREGGDYVINGAKRFITNAPTSDLLMVFARTGPEPGGRGVSAFVVPTHAPGVTIGPKDRKMGQAGAWTSEVFFDDVHVDAGALIGGVEGRGYATAMKALARGRLHIAAICVGIAGRLVEEMTSYARTREQSGHPIAEFQLVQGMLADSETEARAGRALCLEVAEGYDAGTDRRKGPATAKYFCSEMVNRVADRAVQVHGGMGYIRGVAAERFYRDVRVFRIYEGTSQVQQVVIARELLREGAGSHHGHRRG